MTTSKLHEPEVVDIEQKQKVTWHVRGSQWVLKHRHVMQQGLLVLLFLTVVISLIREGITCPMHLCGWVYVLLGMFVVPLLFEINFFAAWAQLAFVRQLSVHSEAVFLFWEVHLLLLFMSLDVLIQQIAVQALCSMRSALSVALIMLVFTQVLLQSSIELQCEIVAVYFVVSTGLAGGMLWPSKRSTCFAVN